MTVATKKIDLAPIKTQIEKVDAEIKAPFPTPPVGAMVVWYARADVREGAEIAAIVTRVDGPGKISLTAFRPQGMPDPTRLGVLHVNHPTHLSKHNSVSVNTGAWDYPDGTIPPKSHYARHTEALNKKRDGLLDQLSQAEAINKTLS